MTAFYLLLDYIVEIQYCKIFCTLSCHLKLTYILLKLAWSVTFKIHSNFRKKNDMDFYVFCFLILP